MTKPTTKTKKTAAPKPATKRAPSKTKHNTREGWLMAAIVELDTKFFAGNGYTLPTALAVSCGFVKGVGAKSIGVCFDEKASAEKTVEMFICPTQAEPVKVLDILLHEMIHASVSEKGHRGMFKKLALEFGLAGKMTATFAEEGSDLHATLATISGRLGHYPHSAMKRPVKKTAANKWVRYASVNIDDFKVVVNEDRVDEHGAPRDPNGDEMVPTSLLVQE